MIRTFLEYLLSRSHNEPSPAKGWFHRLLLRDAKLSRFDTEAQQLDTLLRQSASEVRESLAAQADVAPDDTTILTLPPRRQVSQTNARQNSGHSLQWLTGLAAAAVLLLMSSPNWFQPDAPAVHAGEFSQQLTVVPGQVLQLLTRAAETSQTQLPQLSPLSNLTFPEMPDWQDVALRVESPVQQELDHWQQVWQDLTLRLPSTPEEL